MLLITIELRYRPPWQMLRLLASDSETNRALFSLRLPSAATVHRQKERRLHLDIINTTAGERGRATTRRPQTRLLPPMLNRKFAAGHLRGKALACIVRATASF